MPSITPIQAVRSSSLVTSATLRRGQPRGGLGLEGKEMGIKEQLLVEAHTTHNDNTHKAHARMLVLLL